MSQRPEPRTVLYVANASRIGGGGRVLMDLIVNLDPERFVPAMIAPAEGSLSQWARAHGVPYTISSASDWLSFPGLAHRTWELARAIRHTRASIVHAAAPMCYRALGVAALATGAKRVCHLGFPPEPGQLERSFVAGPDAVIGCYEGQAHDNRERITRLRPSCRVVGIPNGVDTETFAPISAGHDAADIRRSFKTVIAILGHVSEVKGYATFIDAAAQLARAHPDCLFLAVGDDTTQVGYRRILESKTSELGLADRFLFLGHRTDVADVLRAVDIVVLPSRAEGFPLAVLEAMATGKAVIASPVGGVAEAIVHGVSGLLVPPDDPAALTEAIARLLAFPEERARLGAAARARAAELFSVRQFAQSIQAVYDSLLN